MPAVIILKFQQCDLTIELCVQKIQLEMDYKSHFDFLLNPYCVNVLCFCYYMCCLLLFVIYTMKSSLNQTRADVYKTLCPQQLAPDSK